LRIGSVLATSARLCGGWDGGVMSWCAPDLAEDDTRQQAADLNVIFNQ
jgi:hypothetical protein